MQTAAWLAETFGYLFLFYALWKNNLIRRYWPILAAIALGAVLTQGALMLLNHFATGTRIYALEWFWLQIPIMVMLALNTGWIVKRVATHYRGYDVMLPWLSVVLSALGFILLLPTMFLDAWAMRGLTYSMIVLQRGAGTTMAITLALLYGFTRLIPRTNRDGEHLPFSRNATTVWAGTFAYMVLYTVQHELAAFSHQRGVIVEGYNIAVLSLVAVVLFAMAIRLKADGEVFEMAPAPDPVRQEQANIEAYSIDTALTNLRRSGR